MLLCIKLLFAYVILLCVVMILVNVQMETVLPICQYLVDVLMILHQCLQPYQTNTFIEVTANKDQIKLLYFGQNRIYVS